MGIVMVVDDVIVQGLVGVLVVGLAVGLASGAL